MKLPTMFRAATPNPNNSTWWSGAACRTALHCNDTERALAVLTGLFVPKGQHRR